MASTLFDSAIFRDAFGTDAMRAIFSDEATVARYVEVEVALAKVQAGLGLIPTDAAVEIARTANAGAIDLAKLKIETDLVGYPIVGVVHQMAKLAGEAGRYIHWGATTQDIMDTAVVLQVRSALDIIDADLAEVSQSLAGLAEKYRGTVMAGRTHLQHALPVTFGYKCAVWLSMIERHRQRLVELRPRVLVGQFGGAAGTLASLGENGLRVHDALMLELGLNKGDIPWHGARDSVTEATTFLALVTGSLAKIALDVALLMQTEIGEVFEPFVKGRGSSSTMPQKRNPISSELIIASARSVRQDVGLMLDSLSGADHERATGPWHLEWLALPRAFITTAGALYQAKFMTSGLIVDTDRMRQNLDMTGGLIVAEAVMMGLAKPLGRTVAHDLVYAACRSALDKKTSLIDQLRALPEVTQVLDPQALEALVDPANYLGVSNEMIDRVLTSRRT
jgi:3-carboxy-cis,cis-muconate cycloisomerase